MKRLVPVLASACLSLFLRTGTAHALPKVAVLAASSTGSDVQAGARAPSSRWI